MGPCARTAALLLAAVTGLGPAAPSLAPDVADAHLGDWSFKSFYVDPDELQLVDGKSTFAGVNLRHDFTPDLSAEPSRNRNQKSMFSVRNSLRSSILMIAISGRAAMAQDASLPAEASNPATLG